MFNVENKKLEFIQIKLSKVDVIYENKDAILFLINDVDSNQSVKFWIKKKSIFTSVYTDILNVSLIKSDTYKYNMYDINCSNWKTPLGQLTAKELYSFLIKQPNIKLINNVKNSI